MDFIGLVFFNFNKSLTNQLVGFEDGEQLTKKQRSGKFPCIHTRVDYDLNRDSYSGIILSIGH